MNELLADIKAKLQSGDYKNEEHIRLSLVARVLQKLGWDIWNPKEVNTEFIVVPNEDKTRVDVALFLRPFAPAVFIEIKDVGQIQGRLSHIERQLRDYNRNNTAMFTIITDGREWRFYFSQTGGEFSKKCFETFDFDKDNLNDIEESLTTFLSKLEIENGNAKSKAENYLQKIKSSKPPMIACRKPAAGWVSRHFQVCLMRWCLWCGKRGFLFLETNL